MAVSGSFFVFRINGCECISSVENASALFLLEKNARYLRFERIGVCMDKFCVFQTVWILSVQTYAIKSVTSSWEVQRAMDVSVPSVAFKSLLRNRMTSLLFSQHLRAEQTAQEGVRTHELKWNDVKLDKGSFTSVSSLEFWNMRFTK